MSSSTVPSARLPPRRVFAAPPRVCEWHTCVQSGQADLLLVGSCLRSRHVFGLQFDHSIQIRDSLEGKYEADAIERRHSVGLTFAVQSFLCSFLGGACRTTVSVQALRLVRARLHGTSCYCDCSPSLSMCVAMGLGDERSVLMPWVVNRNLSV